MSIDPPKFDERGRRELRAELLDRARVWFPNWRLDGDGRDPFGAILEIAAGISAEVTQRLNKVPEKSFRGMLHWLGKRRRPGASARLPVVFTMSKGADPVVSAEPVALQADADGTPVTLETDAPLRIVASEVQAVFATEPEKNAFYGPFPDLVSLEAPEPGPKEWRLQAQPAPEERRIQLDPPEGLKGGMIVADQQGFAYRIEEAKGGLVKLSRGLQPVPQGALGDPATLRKVEAFWPFDGHQENRQEQYFYLGADALFDIRTKARLSLSGDLPAGAKWSYAAKTEEGEEPRWQPLPLETVKGEEGLFLRKQEDGEIEKREINGVKMRWLRAERIDENDLEQRWAADVRLEINCGDSAVAPSKDLEAVANTAPLVLDQGFYPLGREPRLFDAFYLNWPEAFSKPDAYVRLHFTIGDGFSGPLNALADAKAGLAIIGAVTHDGRLGVIRAKGLTTANPDVDFSVPYQLPKLGSATSRILPDQRVGIGGWDGVLALSATDGADVWVWTLSARDVLAPTSLYLAPAVNHGVPAGGGAVAETLIVNREDGVLVVYALCGGRIFSKPVTAPGAWVEHMAPTDSKVVRVVPFQRAASDIGQSREADGFVVVLDTGKVYWFDPDSAGWNQIDGLTITGDPAPYPLAILEKTGKRLIYCAVGDGSGTEGLHRLVAKEIGEDVIETPLDEPLIGSSLTFGIGETERPEILFATRRSGGVAHLGVWEPLSNVAPYIAPDPAPVIPIAQTPLRLSNWLLLPRPSGALTLYEAPAVLSKIRVLNVANLAITSGTPPEGDDIVLRYSDQLYFRVSERLNGRVKGYEFAVKAGFTPPLHEKALDVLIFKDPAAGKYSGKGGQPDRHKVELDPTDTLTAAGSVLRLGQGVSLRYLNVLEVENGVATLDREVNPATFKYSTAPVRPMRFLIRPTVVVEDVEVLRHVPSREVVIDFEVDGEAVRRTLHSEPMEDGPGLRLILAEVWDEPAEGESDALAITLHGDQMQFEPSQARNPELSWEYWNGRGWWRIPDVEDETQYLLKEGELRFCVPSDLVQTEVVGKSGYWIRARLVGGDYGQETYRIGNTSRAFAETGLQNGARIMTQGADDLLIRDPSTIRAPYVAALKVGYQLCCERAPDMVLTLDNGTYVDRTAANLVPNVRYPVFTPLRNALQIAADGDDAAPGAVDCCASCAQASAPEAVSGEADVAPTGMAAPALYLGFSHVLQGALSLLVRVEEKEQNWSKPMQVEALIGRDFMALIIDDETRGLSETGIIQLACPEEVPPVNLFGQTLHWLRLRAPEDASGGEWQPSLCGVHLNAAWAHDYRTRRNEIVGFSDGSPNQSFRLAHLPVLKETLELFVNEPLGEDERAELQSQGVEVKAEIGGAQGTWIRWTESDLIAAGASGRAFDFDPTSGTVGFGDGVHGMIPPIGVDNIVASTYLSGGGEAGNSIASWSQLNLVTPLRAVEAAIAPEPAAGGSDEQDMATTLRFASANIALRGRAVTLEDFAMHARQFSADIAQARANQPRSGAIRIALVMRGLDPLPSNAVRRELERRLREVSSPAVLSGGLSILKPDLVDIEIDVDVAIDDLADTSAVVQDVETRIRALLNPGSGDMSGGGWPLGIVPDATDIAAAIARIEKILEIERISVRRQDGSDVALTWRQLVVLPAHAVSVRCTAVQLEVA
ncbi:hypothetical protein [Mesorhizobium sp.]|uniref:hypothetical protein n=1 Tax=Mesorhizobium sp. TaxID=1871066 RepID=UPI000FEA3EC9|nr:hypothetical protein [Mesorhizobium sp.]RWO22185.1 MAG: hypothetical protein EOS09_21345 [Mesorhizobium sp.]